MKGERTMLIGAIVFGVIIVGLLVCLFRWVGKTNEEEQEKAEKRRKWRLLDTYLRDEMVGEDVIGMFNNPQVQALLAFAVRESVESEAMEKIRRSCPDVPRGITLDLPTGDGTTLVLTDDGTLKVVTENRVIDVDFEGNPPFKPWDVLHALERLWEGEFRQAKGEVGDPIEVAEVLEQAQKTAPLT